MKKILHITTHLGGGVGRTMLGYFSNEKKNYHEVICLGYLSECVVKKLQHLKIHTCEHMYNKHNEIIKKIPDFDIIIIHWWNHPLLYDFLVRNELPKCRLIIWSHNSGFHPPNIYTRKILTYPDLFVFTTPLSYTTDEVRKLSYEERQKLHTIWSTGGIEEFLSITPKKHEGFNIGYIGTVDYAKIHENFLDMCKKIDIPNIKFYVIGGLKNKQLEKQANEIGLKDKVIFTGIVKDIIPYLEIFDIFGYPLNPLHYGTCDLALQEAMASGIVPIVFDNPMENLMVGNNGMVVRNEQEYIEAIKFLYDHSLLRKALGNECRRHARKKFSIKRLVSEWQKTFDKIMNIPKSEKFWGIKEDITHTNIFLESLGPYGKDFEERIKEFSKVPTWQTETKGSVHNYHSYFPNDETLKKWSRLMKKYR